ncbi:MAG TPA: DUF2513 domain-containing protein [Methylocella sp.]|nr:DUF2513 domain-containing protein [Methylocella sp.]
MKRDMDLIRELLLRFEALDIPPGVVRMLHPSNPFFAVEGFTDREIGHHLRMLVSAGFVETAGSMPFGHDGSIVFRQISWQGHDFLDSVRDPKIWEKTKSGAEAAGGFTVDLLKDLAKGFIRKQIEEYTGVKLP